MTKQAERMRQRVVHDTEEKERHQRPAPRKTDKLSDSDSESSDSDEDILMGNEDWDKLLVKKLRKLSAVELRPIVGKILKGKVSAKDLEKLDKDQLLKKIEDARPKPQPMSKGCITVLIVIVSLAFGLRFMESLYDPNMEEIEAHFEVLGLSADASDGDIRKAYRRLALKLHPDKRKADCIDCDEQLQRVNDAYEILTTQKHIDRFREYRESKLRAAEELYAETQKVRAGEKSTKERPKRKRANQ